MEGAVVYMSFADRRKSGRKKIKHVEFSLQDRISSSGMLRVGCTGVDKTSLQKNLVEKNVRY